MIKFGGVACSIAMVLGFCLAGDAQQSPESVPNGPFETVHLMVVQPSQEPALEAAPVRSLC
jgi:hypothetical protein